MAHTDKDEPFRVTGKWTHKYYIHPEGHAKFTRACRRETRHDAKQALQRGEEPTPNSASQHYYWD